MRVLRESSTQAQTEPAIPHKLNCREPFDVVMTRVGEHALFMCLSCRMTTWHLKNHPASKAYRKSGRRLA